LKRFIYPWKEGNYPRKRVIWKEDDKPKIIMIIKTGLVAFEKKIEVEEEYSPSKEVEKINFMSVIKPRKE
jgi:hypothetical protein